MPIVPDLRLPSGRAAELTVRSPSAPMPRGSEPAHVVDAHVWKLWHDLTASLTGRRDYRLTDGPDSIRPKYAARVRSWWAACADKEVRPAEWLLWEMRWRLEKGSIPVDLVFSATRVLDGKVRRLFRLFGERLGGEVELAPEGREFLRRRMELTRRLSRLVAERRGAVTDRDVADVVTLLFPRGADHAREVVVEVHRRCAARTAELARDAQAGRFVWQTGNNRVAEAK